MCSSDAGEKSYSRKLRAYIYIQCVVYRLAKCFFIFIFIIHGGPHFTIRSLARGFVESSSSTLYFWQVYYIILYARGGGRKWLIVFCHWAIKQKRNYILHIIFASTITHNNIFILSYDYYRYA